MSGELAAFATVLSWSIGVFPFTEASRRLGPASVNLYRLLLACVLLTIAAFFFFSTSPRELFTAPLPSQWLWMGISGVVGLALGDHFAFQSFAILGTRVASVFSCLSPGAALLFGYFILDEKISVIGGLGMFVSVV